jgi:hypothetical protein
MLCPSHFSCLLTVCSLTPKIPFSIITGYTVVLSRMGDFQPWVMVMNWRVTKMASVKEAPERGPANENTSCTYPDELKSGPELWICGPRSSTSTTPQRRGKSGSLGGGIQGGQDLSWPERKDRTTTWSQRVLRPIQTLLGLAPQGLRRPIFRLESCQKCSMATGQSANIALERPSS